MKHNSESQRGFLSQYFFAKADRSAKWSPVDGRLGGQQAVMRAAATINARSFCNLDQVRVFLQGAPTAAARPADPTF